jgi:RNA polymerase sigma factor (sigma-70 family)
VNLGGVVEKIRAGDPEGSEELYRLVSRGLRFYLFRHLGPQDADDVLHSVLLITIQSIRRGGLRDPERVMGFMTTVARRQVAAHIHQAVKTRKESLDFDVGLAVPDGAKNPEQQMAERQQVDLMRKVLEELSPKDREVLYRFYVLEEPHEKICHDMGWTETQFRLLKSRAKAKLAEKAKKLNRKRISPLSMRTSAPAPHS